MRASRHLVLIVSSILLSCASADVVRLDQTKRTPKDPKQVEAFLDEPTRPYKSIAMIEASDQGWGLSLNSLKSKMVQEAAALGGDAVIIGSHSTQSGGAYFVPIGNMWYGANLPEKKMEGKVIVFTDNP